MFAIVGECPFCAKRPVSIKAAQVKIVFDPMIEWRGLAYSCPSCNKILSIQRDPADINRELVRELMAELTSGHRPR